MDVRGNSIPPIAHGAFYIGGWLPCFDNHSVQMKAIAFVQECVKRYSCRDEIIIWNIWNEPRSRPAEECACSHSVESYRQWLANNFEDIDALNEQYGKAWEGFHTISPPAGAMDYAELYLWRQWAMHAVASRLCFMRKAVNELDHSRPIISHVGGSSVVQDIVGDSSDDILNSQYVDFYGTSLPTSPRLKDILVESIIFMMGDWSRHVCKNYWVNELYPDWGDWSSESPIEDFNFKVYGAISCGAKGIQYWQYRAERLGCENNLAGLVNMDGSFKKISYESAKIKKFITANEDFLLKSEVIHDEIGILYSLKSDLINRVENSGKTMFDFDLSSDSPYLYKKSLHGVYALIREMGYTAAWVDSRRMREGLQDIKILYVPEAFILTDTEIGELLLFIDSGGRVIAEEGVTLRTENTWLRPSWPEKGLAELFGTRIIARTSTQKGEYDEMRMFDQTIAPGEFISTLECVDATEVGWWSNGEVAAVEKNGNFFLGTSLGASFYDYGLTKCDDYKQIMMGIFKKCGISPKPVLPDSVYLRELLCDGEKMIFVFNRSAASVEIQIAGKLRTINPNSTEVVKCVLQTD